MAKRTMFIVGACILASMGHMCNSHSPAAPSDPTCPECPDITIDDNEGIEKLRSDLVRAIRQCSFGSSVIRSIEYSRSSGSTHSYFYPITSSHPYGGEHHVRVSVDGAEIKDRFRRLVEDGSC